MKPLPYLLWFDGGALIYASISAKSITVAIVLTIAAAINLIAALETAG